MKLLRRRNRDLKDAPPLHDSQRFAPRSVVSDMLAVNRAYRQNLELKLAVERVHEGEIQETGLLYQVWDAVRDSWCKYYYVTVRRQALKRLRETLGPQGNFADDLPPYAPVWRFQEID